MSRKAIALAIDMNFEFVTSYFYENLGGPFYSFLLLQNLIQTTSLIIPYYPEVAK